VCHTGNSVSLECHQQLNYVRVLVSYGGLFNSVKAAEAGEAFFFFFFFFYVRSLFNTMNVRPEVHMTLTTNYADIHDTITIHTIRSSHVSIDASQHQRAEFQN
jgi:hypothetical protein